MEPESPVAGTPSDRNHCTRRESGMRASTEFVFNETKAMVLVTVMIRSSGRS